MNSEAARSRIYLPVFTGVLAVVAPIVIWFWVAETQKPPHFTAKTDSHSRAPAYEEPVSVGPDLESRLEAELSSAVISVLTQGKSPYAGSPNELSALIAILLDSSQSLKSRRQAAWQLASVGNGEALAALRQSLSNAPPPLRVAIAEALGHCADKEADAVLNELLRDQNEDVIRGAIRGLAAKGTGVAVERLSQLILGAETPEAVRAEAALGLGNIQGADSARTLVRLVSQVNDRDLTDVLLSGLGKLPIEETQEFFRRYVESSNIEVDLRVVALEALGESKSAAAPFLVNYLQSEEPEIRAAAAWAISNLESPGDVVGTLVDRLRSESEPEVRVRLYQALQNQESFDPAVSAVIVTEQDPAARLAGYQLLAREVARDRDTALAAQFDQGIVPRLAELAISGAGMNERLNAVLALKQANSPAAIWALAGIGARSGDATIAQAAKLK